MKKALFAILLILIIIGIWFAVHKVSKPVPVINTPVTEATHPSLSSATFTFDGDPVILKNGKNIAPVDASAESLETDLTSFVAYGDLNGDGKEDAAVLLTQSGVGSGTFIYVAALVSGPVTYKGTNAVFIGDRISPQSITIKKGAISVTYLDRKPDEPLSAEPTVSTTKSYRYSSLDTSLSEQ